MWARSGSESNLVLLWESLTAATLAEQIDLFADQICNSIRVPLDQLLLTTLHRRTALACLCWSMRSFCALNQSKRSVVSTFSVIKW